MGDYYALLFLVGILYIHYPISLMLIHTHQQTITDELEVVDGCRVLHFEQLYQLLAGIVGS